MHHGTEAIVADTSLQDLLGPTGKFPGGKLVESDKGEILFAVGTEQEKVTVNFGRPIAWIGMSARQARRLAKSLRRMADRVDAPPYRNRRKRKNKR